MVDGACRQSAGYDGAKLVFGVSDAAAGAAERVRRAHNQGQTKLRERGIRLFHGLHDGAGRHRLADAGEQIAEELAVLGVADGLQRRSQQPRAVAVENAGVRQIHGEVQTGLPTQRGQHAVRTLRLDHALKRLYRQRLDIDHVRDALVGHNRGGIGIHQHGGNALFAQRLARLRSGVIKLRRLPDNDGPGADN